MNNLQSLVKDLKRFDENLNAVPFGNRIKILFKEKEICYLAKAGFNDWSLQFVGEPTFTGREDMRALNGIARSVSRFQLAGIKRKVRQYRHTHGFLY